MKVDQFRADIVNTLKDSKEALTLAELTSRLSKQEDWVVPLLLTGKDRKLNLYFNNLDKKHVGNFYNLANEIKNRVISPDFFFDVLQRNPYNHNVSSRQRKTEHTLYSYASDSQEKIDKIKTRKYNEKELKANILPEILKIADNFNSDLEKRIQRTGESLGRCLIGGKWADKDSPVWIYKNPKEVIPAYKNNVSNFKEAETSIPYIALEPLNLFFIDSPKVSSKSTDNLVNKYEKIYGIKIVPKNTKLTKDFFKSQKYIELK